MWLLKILKNYKNTMTVKKIMKIMWKLINFVFFLVEKIIMNVLRKYMEKKKSIYKNVFGIVNLFFLEKKIIIYTIFNIRLQ